MARLSPAAQDQYPAFDQWLGYVFLHLVLGNPRVLTAFWKWSSFKDTPENRGCFSYGTPPTLDLLDKSLACEYDKDGTVLRVRYGQTWSAEKIGINTALLDLFEDAILKPVPYSDDAHLLIEVMEGTILHEMVHWSYFKTGVDEKKKYAGQEEFGTEHFELEAFGHPIRLPKDRLCESKSKDFPYLGTKTEKIMENSDKGPRAVARVKAVALGSPAAVFGIRVDDLIRTFDGEEIWPAPQSFAEQLQQKKPGQWVRLEVYRPSNRISLVLDVSLGAQPVGK